MSLILFIEYKFCSIDRPIFMPTLCYFKHYSSITEFDFGEYNTSHFVPFSSVVLFRTLVVLN